MLTVDFDRLGVRPHDRVLDLGSGPGRHAFEALRRGARVVAVDLRQDDLIQATAMFAAMHDEVPSFARGDCVRGNALSLPFGDASFDCVIAAEVLEHVHDDAGAVDELVRVLRPGGTIAVTVPRWYPERICWALSEGYHRVAGGHVRIYKKEELRSRLRAAGLCTDGSHYAHALHSPYWWLRCAAGPDSPLPRAYHRFLVWDIVRKPRLTRTLERTLNPVLGKSLVVYARKGARGSSTASEASDVRSPDQKERPVA